MKSRAALDAVVDTLSSELPVEDWGHWLVYLLERLDHKTTGERDKAYEMALLQLRSDIDTRLVNGQW